MIISTLSRDSLNIDASKYIRLSCEYRRIATIWRMRWLVDQDKRQLRKLKRDIKRAGNKRRRQHLKRQLAEAPEEAPHADFDFGRASSAGYNAMDRDATRRRPRRESS